MAGDIGTIDFQSILLRRGSRRVFSMVYNDSMTLLIKNVRLVDGVHEFPERSDVFVTGESISAIGDFPDKRADEILDGQGAWLAPGFIDVNTDSDHYFTLFNYPSQADFLRQGVTTIFGGMCGSSLAPLLYGGLESIRKWSDTTNVNVSWHTTHEFLSVLDKRPLAVNFGTLAGHSTIRRAIVGDDVIRDLTKNEREIFGNVIARAIKEGSFGMSSGLGYVHASKTPESEIISLANIVKAANGIYATHLRRMTDGVQDAVAETVRVARTTGVRTLISHFVPILGSQADYEAALTALDALPPDLDLRFDIYPSPSMMIALYTLLPQWAQSAGIEAMATSLKDDWYVSRIKKDMAAIDPMAMVVAQAPGNDVFVGKSLVDIAAMYELSSPQDALIAFMRATNLKATLLYRNLDEALIRQAIVNPRSFIASNAPSFDESISPLRLKSERTTGTFAKFLALVLDEGIMPVRDAVRKISYEPARFFGLPSGFGEIKEGGRADFACFRKTGIKFTVVNGRIVFSDGEVKNVLPGKVLRHS